jgi:glucose-6-phosphate isomerase
MSNFSVLRTYRSQFDSTLQTLIQQDPARSDFKLRSVKGKNSLSFDFSKTHLNLELLALAEAFVENSGLNEERERLFRGEKVNLTENRAAEHPKVRSPEYVETELGKMREFVNAVHEGHRIGSSNKTFTDVINLGIGGSDLGPRFVCDALSHFHIPGLRCHFVANVDPEELLQTLKKVNPESTLFLIASKSFSTQETLLNGALAKTWLIESLKQKGIEPKIERHFVAISSNVEKAVAFGIQAENCFEMSDSIGGRFSLWSNIGLSIALQIGMNRFTELLAGAHAMDNHFRTEPTRKNIPVLMALISLWYRNFWGAQSYAILPYSQRLALLPAFLQQLEMESLGKSVLKNGQPSPHQTGGVIWGGIGTNGQHAFHQLIHQGTLLIPADFITIEKSALDATLSPELQAHQTHQHEVLLKHARAQMQALVQGKTREEAEAELRKAGHSKEAIALLAPHKMIPGNRPCVEISLNKLNPFNLGQLLAAYEHKVFALSVFLNINPFDQFGVELGKALAEA